MDKLTDLLKEAKPLYKQRQKRKTIAKLTLMLATPAILMSSICQLYVQGNDIYVALQDNSLQNELIEDEFGLLGLKY
ncbi:hypothetical protein IJ425_01015 [bacterium]|nr:hypothetical protein [bacterium]